MIDKILSELRGIANAISVLSQIKTLDNYRDTLLSLNSMKARVNELKPDIQFFYDEQLAIETENIMKEYKDNIKGNASYIKAIIAGKMKSEQRVLNFADRINSSIDLISKNMITIISSLKAEMNNH